MVFSKVERMEGASPVRAVLEWASVPSKTKYMNRSP